MAYLGDSVYVQPSGYGWTVQLTTNNGYSDDPRNVIVLEHQQMENLIHYVEALQAAFRKWNTKRQE